MKKGKLGPQTTFAQFAAATIAATDDEEEKDIVRQAWTDVGVVPGKDSGPDDASCPFL